MQFGMIHYKAPGDTLEAFLDYVAETGFDVVELQLTDVWPEGNDRPEAEAERVRGLFEERGIGVSAYASGNDFVYLDEDAVRHQVERMDRISKIARILGTKILRTEGGSRKDEVPREREGEAIGECLKRCLDFAEREDVTLAVDNHGHVTNDPDTLLTALKAADSPRAGTNLDTANYRWSGHSVEKCREIYDAVAPYARHTHLKDCTGTQPDGTYIGTVHGEGEVDLIHAVAALDRQGYKGPYIAEWEGPASEDNAVAYARCLEWMRRHIAD
jgi:sugar phosphate isomerase/epimerase